MLFRINESYPFWLGSALVVVAVLLVFIFIKEPKDYEDTPREETPDIIESIKQVLKEDEKSPLRILLAILFWFVSYNAIEAFFTLYGVNHLGLEKADAVLQLGFFSLIFLVFSLPAGYIGGRFGRKRTIMTGIILMTLTILSIRFFPADFLAGDIFTIPGLGGLMVVGGLLMIAGLSWALININSLPMVVDMTSDARVGTYTGLYYFASTLAAIAGPIIFGWVVQLGGNNYNLVMLFSPIFMVLALLMMIGVKRGEAKTVDG
jgi:MFS-type transporter involved in bile tolerance (Atg22 family)